MRYFNFAAVAALTLGVGLVGHASAAPITGAYTYSYAGPGGADATCVSPSSGTRDDFSGSGANSVGGADTINFSACNNTPGQIMGGSFLISDAAGTVIGSFSGTSTGLTTSVGGNPGFNIDDGTYHITHATGSYIGVADGNFEVATGPVGSAFQGQGELAFGQTLAQANAPEPASLALAGMGLLIAGLTRKSFKRKA